MRQKAKSRKPCEHLNVETNTFSGVEMAVCKDCHAKVDPAIFEPVVEAKNESIPIPSAKPGERHVESLERVLDLIVGDLVAVPGLPKPFFPVFGLKTGDVLVALRAKDGKAKTE